MQLAIIPTDHYIIIGDLLGYIEIWNYDSGEIAGTINGDSAIYTLT